MDSTRDREEVFRDFVVELGKRIKEEQRAAAKAARDAYRKVSRREAEAVLTEDRLLKMLLASVLCACACMHRLLVS